MLEHPVLEAAGPVEQLTADQQVRGLASRLDRDPERQRADGEKGQEQRPPIHGERERTHGEQREPDGGRGERGPVAKGLELIGVVDLRDQQDGCEHQSARRRDATVVAAAVLLGGVVWLAVDGLTWPAALTIVVGLAGAVFARR